MPEQQRGGDDRDQGQDQVGLAQVAAGKARRPQHLADVHGAEHPDEHQDREHIDQEGEPALLTQPGQRGVLGDGPDEGDQDRRGENEKAPEDEGVDQPRPQALEQLALAEDDRGLVTYPSRGIVGPRNRCPGPDQCQQEPHALPEQHRARPRQRGQHHRGHDDAYVPFTFLISAEIAGTTSCRSPITA